MTAENSCMACGKLALKHGCKKAHELQQPATNSGKTKLNHAKKTTFPYFNHKILCRNLQPQILQQICYTENHTENE